MGGIGEAVAFADLQRFVAQGLCEAVANRCGFSKQGGRRIVERAGGPDEQAGEVAAGVFEGAAAVEHAVIVDQEDFIGLDGHLDHGGFLECVGELVADLVVGRKRGLGEGEVAAPQGEGRAEHVAEDEPHAAGSLEERSSQRSANLLGQGPAVDEQRFASALRRLHAGHHLQVGRNAEETLGVGVQRRRPRRRGERPPVRHGADRLALHH